MDRRVRKGEKERGWAMRDGQEFAGESSGSLREIIGEMID